MNNCRDLPIKVYLNQSAVGKIPRDAPRNAWAKFHAKWTVEDMTAHDLAANIWRGYSFAAVHNGRKIKDRFTEAWHLALDFDCADERACFDALMDHNIIEMFCSFLYYTPGSNPPAYKSRAVFVFDEPVTNLDTYEEILDAFAWWFPDSDQSTTDASRFFYGSKGTEVKTNWSILPLEAAKEIVRQYRTEVPKRNKLDPKPYKPQSTDENKVADALRFIPPRMDYIEWLRVVMSVHSVFPGSKGVNLLESWSPGYNGEVEDKFRSFERTSTNGVTIKTLYKMAIDKGWRPVKKKFGKQRSTMASKRKELMTADINNGNGFRIRGS